MSTRDELDKLIEEAAAAGAIAPRRSGGPRSSAGRATSAANSITHGVTCKTPVLPRLGETVEDWTDFESGVIESLAPVGELETELSRRVALTLWRLRRCSRAETAAICEQTEAHLVDMDNVGPDVMTHTRAAPFEHRSGHVTRYEVTLNRLLNSTLVTIELLQRRRAGDRPAVGRLDLTTGE